jgi:DNA invertase Pin-like site-specific DNA recombinase
MHNVSISTITRPIRRGEERSGAKLTARDIVDIKNRLNSGCGQKEIAADFKIHQSTVSKILNKKAWKHI